MPWITSAGGPLSRVPGHARFGTRVGAPSRLRRGRQAKRSRLTPGGEASVKVTLLRGGLTGRPASKTSAISRSKAPKSRSWPSTAPSSARHHHRQRRLVRVQLVAARGRGQRAARREPEPHRQAHPAHDRRRKERNAGKLRCLPLREPVLVTVARRRRRRARAGRGQRALATIRRRRCARRRSATRAARSSLPTRVGCRCASRSKRPALRDKCWSWPPTTPRPRSSLKLLRGALVQGRVTALRGRRGVEGALCHAQLSGGCEKPQRPTATATIGSRRRARTGESPC